LSMPQVFGKISFQEVEVAVVEMTGGVFEDVTVVLAANGRSAAHQIHRASGHAERFHVKVGRDAKWGRLAQFGDYHAIFSRCHERGKVGDVEIFAGVFILRGASDAAFENGLAVGKPDDDK